MRLFKFIKNLLKLNIWSTIYLNFKMFDFKIAVKLPIYVYGKTDFRDLSGKIIIDAPIKRGMIVIGKKRYIINSVPVSTFTIRGTIIFKGEVSLGCGHYIFVSQNATLTIGTEGTLLGAYCKLICFESITIGNRVRMAWEAQLIDSNFHYFEGENTAPLTKPIVLNDNLWIGNRVTIMRGTVLPSNTTVASNSLLNKDYTEYGENILLGGMPAKLLKKNIKRIFDEKIEAELDKKYKYNRTRL